MLRTLSVARTVATTSRCFSDASSPESFKYRPNLAFHKAKKMGKPVGKLLNAKVQTPKFEGEVLFGLFPVLEALSAERRRLNALYIKDSVRERASSDPRVSRILALAEEKKVHTHRLTHKQMDSLTQFQLHNGVLLDATPLPVCTLTPFSMSIYLDRVLDPGNLGAIGRSALFFGADSLVYAQGRGPSSITPSMSKASAGALEHFPVIQCDGFHQFHKFARSQNALLLGTSDAESAARFDRTTVALSELEVPKDRPVVLVLGDEGVGMTPEVAEQCDQLISIPSVGRSNTHVTSLNVSVVAGILLHHIANKRRN